MTPPALAAPPLAGARLTAIRIRTNVIMPAAEVRLDRAVVLFHGGTMSDEQAVKTPKHLWIFGALALLWNGGGAFDYLMTETRNEAYMGQFTPEQLELFYGFPPAMVAFWAIAVWGGVLGAILLLMRRKLAFGVLAVAFAAMVVTAIYQYGFTNAAAVMGPGGVVFTVVIFVVSLLLVIYAKRMAARGVLR